MISPARWAAFEALRAADPGRGGGRDLASALASTRGITTDPRDRALATELTLGVERWRAALDATIAVASGRAIDTIDLPALLSLRLALFQLRYLTRLPSHAVVNDAVEMARRAGAAWASGFVNGVLRSLLRGDLNAGLPPRPDDDERAGSGAGRWGPASDRARRGAGDPAGEKWTSWLAYLTTTLSHPEWLVRRWHARYGITATEQWALFNNQPGALTIRVNTRRISVDDARARLEADGVATERCRHAPNALTVTSGNPISSRLHDEGLIALMDEASQMVGALAAASLTGVVLDACAAPGGKTLVLACDLPRETRLIAADRRPRRVALLSRSLARYGLDDVPVLQHDAARGVPFRDLDAILVDAPCSGLGTIRRDPDIRWRRTEADLATLAAAERALLHETSLAIKPGGRLVYATCSSEPEENELVVDAFLADHRDFARAVVTDDRFTPFIDAHGDFRTLPHRDGLESFYAAVLTRHL